MFPFHKFDTNDNKEKELIYSQKRACMIMSLPLLLFWVLIHSGTSLAVQWSCLSFHRRVHGFLSGQGTKIPTGGQEKKKLFSIQKRGTLVRGYQAGRLLLLRRFSRVQLCPTPRPWDSPGKNTGVGCRFLLQCMKVKIESQFAQSRPTLSNPVDCSPPGSSVHGIFQVRVLQWGTVAFSGQEG